jgi:hypothetical protein
MLLEIHFSFALLFVLYIAVDRLYIRNFLQEESQRMFYARVKWPMAFISLVLVLSGTVLLYEYFNWLLLVKGVVALGLLMAFFYCPLFMKDEPSLFKRMMYRYFVVVLTIITYSLGIYI